MSVYTERILTFDAAGAHSPTPPDTTGVSTRFGKKITGTLRFHIAARKMHRAFLQLAREESFDLVIFHGEEIFPVIKDFNELPIVADIGDAHAMRIRQHMRYAPSAELPL